MAQWDKLLKSLGFSDSEARVYLEALELGPSSVQAIAKKADVSRVTAYAVIENLTKQGLMSSYAQGKKTLYTAESPERLLSFMQNRLQGMQTTLREVKNALDELKLKQRGKKPVVKLFEGPKAFKTIQEDVLRSKPAEILELGNVNAITRAISLADIYAFGKAQEKLGIKIRALLVVPASYNKRKSAHIKYLDERRYKFNGDVFVYGDKVALSTFQDKMFSVLIESPAISEAIKTFFELAWKHQ